MSGPLSPWTYFRRNRRRVLPLLLVIVLAVFAVSLTAVLTGSMIESSKLTWVKPYERYALITAVQKPLDPELTRQLTASPHASRVLPVVNANIQVYGIFGSEPRLVLGLKQGDMQWFTNQADLRLDKGRLPAVDEDGVALHEDIIKSKGLRLGDWVGRGVDNNEFLPGLYRVVGILSGPYPIGLIAYGRLKGGSPASSGERALLIFPKNGHQPRLAAQLAGLPRDRITVATYATEKQRFDREVANMEVMIWILNLVTVITLSLSVGLLNIIFFIQRMGEYGILAAMGFRRSFLLRRTLIEVVLATGLGWGSGLALSQAIFILISHLIYEPRGIYLTGIDSRVLAYTTPIPVMIAIFSLLCVFWYLWRLDPVSIVERRD